MGSVRAGGAITADIQSGPRLFGGNSPIQRVQSIGSDVLGHIYAPSGPIFEVSASGTIGASGNSIDIWSRDENRKLQADAIYANIDTKFNSGTGDLWHLATTAGSFAGSINTRHIDGPNSGDGLTIAGNLDADIVASGQIDELIDIAGSITSAGSITAGSSGLAGQIIINSGNATSNAWAGSVTVGTTTLSPVPNYATTSASLGGGAVGLAPFRLHYENCIPEDGYVGAPPLDTVIRLRWYGPLEWTTGYPATVEYKSGSMWIDITTWFEFQINTSNPRELMVIPLDLGSDWGTVQYRITPTTNLKCGGVSGTPSVTQNGDVLQQYQVQFIF